MLGLSIHLPTGAGSPSDDGVEASVRRAMGEAEGVSGAFAAPPCVFRRLTAAAAARLAPPCPAPPLGPRPAGARPAGAARWIAVTCRTAGEAGRRTYLRERCLTAAQRFMLSLSCDDVDNGWVAEVPGAAAFREAGVELGDAVPVGLIWYG